MNTAPNPSCKACTCKDPCSEASTIKSKFAAGTLPNNAKSLYDAYESLKTKTSTSTTTEWGSPIYMKLNGTTLSSGVNYLYTNVTEGVVDHYIWTPEWNFVSGVFTVGCINTHPNRYDIVDCLSVDDVFCLVDVNDLYKNSEGSERKDLLNNNVQITSVGAYDNYTAIVKDWTALNTLLASKTAVQYKEEIHNLINEEGYSPEAAFNKIFGSALNLYRSNKLKPYDYSPLTQDPEWPASLSKKTCTN